MRDFDEIFEEDYYINALAEINHDDFNTKDWLIKHFELYKLTLN